MSSDPKYTTAHDALIDLADAEVPVDDRVLLLRILAGEASLLAELLENDPDEGGIRERLASYLKGLQA